MREICVCTLRVWTFATSAKSSQPEACSQLGEVRVGTFGAWIPVQGNVLRWLKGQGGAEKAGFQENVLDGEKIQI